MIDPRRAAIDRPEDHRAIAQLYRTLIDAWNRHSADEVACHFSSEAEFISGDGFSARGSEAILALLTQAFRDDSPVAMEIAEIRTRKTSFHVGVLQGCLRAVPPESGEHVPERAMVQTMVTSSEHGFWQIESFQSTEVRPGERPDLQSPFLGSAR